MALLTDRTLAASSAITASTLIHIVDVNDQSQNFAGSSYKANLGQLASFFSGTSVNIYNSDGNLTGNRTLSQGSFDLDFTGDENSRFRTFYTSSSNPLDFGGINHGGDSTSINHYDDTNGFIFGSTLLPGNSSMNVIQISTGGAAGVAFNAFDASLFHYDGIGIVREIKSDINGVSINQGGGSGYYLPNTYGFSGQVMTTDGAGNTSWQYPVTFTGGSGNCITDFYVSNIHGCSPINIQPTSPDDVYIVNGGGNVGIGVTSATTKLHISGDTIINSDYLMLSDTLTTIPALNFKGFVNVQDSDNSIGYFGFNLNTSGETGLFIYNNSVVGGGIQTFGSNHIRNGGPHIVGSDFYRNKVLISANNSSDGMIIKPKSDDPSATLWFEMDTASVMILKGDGVPSSGNAFLGIALNPDGTEMPSSNLQVGGTGTTGTFKYRDGNQQNGYVLTSDANGNASWQPLSSLSGSSVISVTGVTTSAYTATTSYSYYGVEYSGITNIEIPDATGLNGFTFRIKDERGTAATYPIIITPSSGNIDGNPSVTMSINYMSLTLVARNNNWWII